MASASAKPNEYTTRMLTEHAFAHPTPIHSRPARPYRRTDPCAQRTVPVRRLHGGVYRSRARTPLRACFPENHVRRGARRGRQRGQPAATAGWSGGIGERPVRHRWPGHGGRVYGTGHRACGTSRLSRRGPPEGGWCGSHWPHEHGRICVLGRGHQSAFRYTGQRGRRRPGADSRGLVLGCGCFSRHRCRVYRLGVGYGGLDSHSSRLERYRGLQKYSAPGANGGYDSVVQFAGYRGCVDALGRGCACSARDSRPTGSHQECCTAVRLPSRGGPDHDAGRAGYDRCKSLATHIGPVARGRGPDRRNRADRTGGVGIHQRQRRTVCCRELCVAPPAAGPARGIVRPAGSAADPARSLHGCRRLFGSAAG